MSSSAPRPRFFGPLPYITIQCDWETAFKSSIHKKSTTTSSQTISSTPSTSTPTSTQPSPPSPSRFPSTDPSRFWLSSYIAEKEDDDSVCEANCRVDQKTGKVECDTADMIVDVLSPHHLSVACTRTHATSIINAPIASYTQFHPQGQEIFAIDLSPAGELGVSGGEDGNLRVWDALSGTLVRDLTTQFDSDSEGHTGDITSCRFFPSGSVILSSALDTTLKIWSVEDGECAATLKGHQRPVTQTQLIDRGRHFISSSLDGTLRLWDCSTATTLTTYCHDKNAVRGTPAPINDCILLSESQHDITFPVTALSSTQSEDTQHLTGYLIIGAYQDSYLRGFDVRVGNSIFFTPVAAPATRVIATTQHHVLVGTEKGIIQCIDLRQPSSPLYSIFKNDAAIHALVANPDQTFWAANGEGEVTQFQSSSSGTSWSIISELSGIDCEPVRGLVINSSNNMAFTAARGAIRKYTFNEHIQR